MNCPICRNEMVDATATNNLADSYKYCRTCKKELAEMTRPDPNPQEYARGGREVRGYAYAVGGAGGGLGSKQPSSYAMPEPTLHSSAYCDSHSGGEHYRHMTADECKCQRIYYDPVLNVWCDRGPVGRPVGASPALAAPYSASPLFLVRANARVDACRSMNYPTGGHPPVSMHFKHAGSMACECGEYVYGNGKISARNGGSDPQHLTIKGPWACRCQTCAYPSAPRNYSSPYAPPPNVGPVVPTPNPNASRIFSKGDRCTWRGHRGTVDREGYIAGRAVIALQWEDKRAVKAECSRLKGRPTVITPRFYSDGRPADRYNTDGLNPGWPTAVSGRFQSQTPNPAAAPQACQADCNCGNCMNQLPTAFMRAAQIGLAYGMGPTKLKSLADFHKLDIDTAMLDYGKLEKRRISEAFVVPVSGRWRISGKIHTPMSEYETYDEVVCAYSEVDAKVVASICKRMKEFIEREQIRAIVGPQSSSPSDTLRSPWDQDCAAPEDEADDES